jgi:hypothetical protein
VSTVVSNPVTGRRDAWARGLTIDRCAPISAFRRDDFPTFGTPASAISPQRVEGEEVTAEISTR